MDRNTPWTGDLHEDNWNLWNAIPQEVKDVLRLSWHDRDYIVSGHFGNSVLRSSRHDSTHTVVVFGDWEGEATLYRLAVKSPAEVLEALKDHANGQLGKSEKNPKINLLGENFQSNMLLNEIFKYNPRIKTSEEIETQDLPVLKSTDSVFIRESVIYLVEGKDMEAIQKWAKEVNQQNPSSIKGIIIK